MFLNVGSYFMLFMNSERSFSILNTKARFILVKYKSESANKKDRMSKMSKNVNSFETTHHHIQPYSNLFPKLQQLFYSSSQSHIVRHTTVHVDPNNILDIKDIFLAKIFLLQFKACNSS